MIRSYEVEAGARTGLMATHVATVFLGSLAVALLAQLSVPLWPVPITGQTLGVMGVAFLLGQKRGISAVALYLGYGALGLPVFAGGSAGAAVFLGPTGGYLVGFLLAAVVVGSVADWLRERARRNRAQRSTWPSLLALSGAFLGGTLVIYATGITHLASFVGWENVLRVGIVPFLAGDALKFGILLTAAAAMIQRGSPESS